MIHAGLAHFQELLPQGYNIVKCINKEHQPCGCYTALKSSKQESFCKIHGPQADKGAEAALTSLFKAGLCGPVLTQCPLYTEAGKHQSRALPSFNRTSKGVRKSKGGVFSKSVLKLDILLCSASGTHFAAVEVQGSSHRDARNKHRDAIKAAAVAQTGNMRLFDFPACVAEYRPRGGRGRSGVKMHDGVSHFESVAFEIVKFLL